MNDPNMNAGGSAFPITSPTKPAIYMGLTKRDYFAAAALTGILAANIEYYSINQSHYGAVDNATGAATSAYRYADAMLKVRSQ